jgi:DNA-binding transcriptional ArsR family regulator
MADDKPDKPDLEAFELQARICKAFAHPARLRILDLVGQREQGVSSLQEALGLSRANVSQHLAILKSVGIIATRRKGKQVFCFLAIPEVKRACGLIREVLLAQIARHHRVMSKEHSERQAKS